MVVMSTPSPKQRRVPHCRTCGSPMRGHKKDNCNSAQASLAPAHPTVKADDDLENKLGELQLSVPSDQVVTKSRRCSSIVNQLIVQDDQSETKSRRRSSFMKQPSLESLSGSTLDTLDMVMVAQREEMLRAKSYTPSPSAVFPVKENASPTVDDVVVARKPRASMPGSLIQEFSLEDIQQEENKDAEGKFGKLFVPTVKVEPGHIVERPPSPTSILSKSTSDSSPPTFGPTKKRKSVRISLPGPAPTRSSLRLQAAQILDPSQASAMLRAHFFKTSVQQAYLFKFISKDAESVEKAAEELGLQCHYYRRGRDVPELDREVSGSEGDLDYLIVGRNEKAIEKELQTIKFEDLNIGLSGSGKASDKIDSDCDKEKLSPKTVNPYFSNQLTAAGSIVVGAAAMWAGLAFS